MEGEDPSLQISNAWRVFRGLYVWYKLLTVTSICTMAGIANDITTSGTRTLATICRVLASTTIEWLTGRAMVVHL
jgi:hypothetical protein